MVTAVSKLNDLCELLFSYQSKGLGCNRVCYMLEVSQSETQPTVDLFLRRFQFQVERGFKPKLSI